MTLSTADVAGQLVLDLPGGPTQAFTLSKACVTIGRATTSDIVLRDSKVLRTHARVECSTEGCEVVNLGSAGGMRVNGVSVARATLAPGDVLSLGDTTLRFERRRQEPDPEATLQSTPSQVYLHETAVPRVAVHTSERTWEVPLAGDSLTIGRHPDCDIVLDSPAVALHHAMLERKGDSFRLRNLQTAHDTWTGSRRASSVVVDDGDTVEIGDARLEFKRGFVSDDLAAVELNRGVHVARRPVVVVPGFAGSNLWRGSEQIWPPRTVWAEPELLRVDGPLDAKGLVNKFVIVPNLIRRDQYGFLVDYLEDSLGYETGNDLLEFGYDFRQDNRASAAHLAAAIEDWNVTAPITIIAHSMGCLVARYYVERLGGARRVERVILIGGPHGGAPYAAASLLKGPNLLPMGLMNARLRDVLGTYASWYQILPLDLLSDESWLPQDQRRLLRLAHDFRAELGHRSSVPTVCVFGYGFKTITGVTMKGASPGGGRDADFVVTTRGDGTIPEASAVMQGAHIHPVRQRHGSLYMDNDVKMRLKIELTR